MTTGSPLNVLDYIRRMDEEIRKLKSGMGTVRIPSQRIGDYVVELDNTNPNLRIKVTDLATNAVTFFGGESTILDQPKFSWPGVMNILEVSPAWVVETDGSYNEIVVTFGVPAAIVFNIRINSLVKGTITTSASGGFFQTFSATQLIVFRNDMIQLDLTSFGSGLAQDVAVTFRNTV